MARVWEKSAHAGTELLMMLAIADFSDDDGKAYPSIKTLAQKCRMRPRNCQYILKNLEQSGELSIFLNKGTQRGTNLYRVNLLNLGVQWVAGVQSIAGVQQSARGGAIQCAIPMQPIAPKPSVNHQEPSSSREAKKPHRSKSVDSVPEGFDEFWIAYDKKVGRANSIRAWKSIKPDAALVQLIVSAAKTYSASREQQYRKDPERWLKYQMWQDEALSTDTASKPEWMVGAL